MNTPLLLEMLYSYGEWILPHALNLVFCYQLNSIHAVLVSYESPWRSYGWNSKVSRCKSRDSEGLRVALISSFVKGRLPSTFFNFSRYGRASTSPKERMDAGRSNNNKLKWSIFTCKITFSSLPWHFKAHRLKQSKRTKKQMDIFPKKGDWWNTIN